MNRYCAEHLGHDQRCRRTNGNRRLYSSAAWERTRKFVLRRDPLCKIGIVCGGTEPSTEVDHVIRAEVWIAEHGGDPRHFFDEENLQGACKADHSLKTQTEIRQ